jgi:hypothetical protein
VADDDRLQRAFRAIDAANADDPATVLVDGVARPKEQAHAEMAVAWVRRLRPDASEALLLAARAHHVRRWEIPRSSEPDGRAGYLRWRRRLQQHHAEVAGALMRDAGYGDELVARVQAIIRKERLRTDPEVGTLEDALALVFLETQLADLAARLDEDLMVDVLAKTLAKMTPEGRAAAAALPVDEHAGALLGRASLAASPGSVGRVTGHGHEDPTANGG